MTRQWRRFYMESLCGKHSLGYWDGPRWISEIDGDRVNENKIHQHVPMEFFRLERTGTVSNLSIRDRSLQELASDVFSHFQVLDSYSLVLLHPFNIKSSREFHVSLSEDSHSGQESQFHRRYEQTRVETSYSNK